MKKRVLLIGSMNSLFTMRYITKIYNQCELVIIDNATERKAECESFYTFCDEKNIPVIGLYHDTSYTRCLKYAAIIKSMPPFDVCHIMYFTSGAAMLAKICESNFGEIVVNYWGSDFYKVSSDIEKDQYRLLEVADRVIVPAVDMKKKVLEKYPFLSGKVHEVLFDLPVVSLLEKGISDKVGESLCLKTDKIVVVCGYSGAREHQHNMMITALKCIDKLLQEKIFVVFPVTYGLSSAAYMQEIELLLKDVHFEYAIYREYMSEEQVAYLRKNTDIFILAETTDAFSASLQESVYSGAVVLKGSWLKYSLLDEGGVFMQDFDDEKSLQLSMEAILSDWPYYKQRSANNSQLLKAIREKNGNIENWEKYYDVHNDSHRISDNYDTLLYVKKRAQIQTDREYLYHLVIDEWLKKRINNIQPVKEYVEKHAYQRILLYGAGELGNKVYQELKNIERLYVDICDRNTELSEVAWYRGRILRPDEFDAKEYDCVLIALERMEYQILEDMIETKCVLLSDIILEQID